MGLEEFGLTPDQLLGRAAPGDMTLREIESAFRNSEAWEALARDSLYPERIEFIFGWRDKSGREVVCPKTSTLDQWRERETTEMRRFLSVSDGGGGVRAAPKIPELA